MTFDLDEKDSEILAVLKGNARISNAELARRVGFSPSACLARVRRLERGGIIVGYRTIVGRPGSKEQVEGWADIRFIDPPPGLMERFAQLVAAAPEVIEAHRVAGRYDYVIRFCSGDIGSWNEFRKGLDALGCVAQSRFSLLVEPLK